MKVTERHIQPILMMWAIDRKNHTLVIPNSTIIFNWEADLLSVTKAGLIHEYEIKLNIQDYKADSKKVYKHKNMVDGWGRIPNYFWYVTFEFDIVPPNHAGWIKISRTQDDLHHCMIDIKVDAPRLTNKKMSEWQRLAAGRIISHHLKYEYAKILRTHKEINGK